MDTSIERREASRFRRDIGIAVLIALALQGMFTAALALPETSLAIAPRFVVGLISVPFSALCGTLLLRSRHRERRVAQMVLLFGGLMVIVVVAGLVFSAATGNYDLP
jgi:hypothetical protein